MPVFRRADFGRPEDFHEVAGERVADGGKVGAQPQLVEKPCRAGPVGVPAAPDALPVRLPANRKTAQGLFIQFQYAAVAQSLDNPEKDEVGGARTIGGRRGLRLEEEPPVAGQPRGALETKARVVARGVRAANGHRGYPRQDEAVDIWNRLGRRPGGGEKAENQNDFHGNAGGRKAIRDAGTRGKCEWRGEWRQRKGFP